MAMKRKTEELLSQHNYWQTKGTTVRSGRAYTLDQLLEMLADRRGWQVKVINGKPIVMLAPGAWIEPIEIGEE